MFRLLAVLTVFSALTMLVAGSLSLLRNTKKREHQWFFILTVALAIWMPSNFYDSNVIHSFFTVFFTKLDFSFAIVIAWVLPQFVVALVTSPTFRSVHKTPYLAATKTYRIISSAVGLLLIGLILSNQLIHVSIVTGALVITTSALFWLYVAAITFFFVYALAVLWLAYKKSIYNRGQGLDLIWFGFSIAIIANIVTNLVFPSFLDQRSLIKELNIIGYLGILVLVACLYIAITTRRLFDIRLVLARSLAYVMLLVFVGALYAGLISLIGVTITGTHAETRTLLVSILLTFVAAFLFQYLRNFFSRVTNRLFFRDIYDPQAVLNQLNSVTTSTINLEELVKKSSNILQDAIKSSLCYFVLLDGGSGGRVVGTAHAAVADKDIDQLTEEVQKIIKPHTSFLTEYVDGQARLKSKLEALQIELVTPLYANKSFIGFIAFGTKQNGTAYSHQDVKFISIAADLLAVAIQNALRFEEIEAFNMLLQERVDDATKKLRRSNEKLRVLDETKDDFISMASHQLRTPLTSVKGYLSMVLEGDAGDLNQNQRKLLGQSFISAQRMVYLIADLLNLSRLNTGKFVIESTPVNLSDVVQAEVEQLSETAKSRNIELVYSKPKDFPLLMLDDTKIHQVVMNFLDNAVYYTPSGGKIEVVLQQTDTAVEYLVKDNGIGVPKHDQHKLFTKFYRANNAKKARPDGTGLGLFMAKKVVVAQNGVVIFESEEGKGSTFGFSFSKADHQVPADATKRA